MDDVLEILWLPVDTYAEYWGGLWFLAHDVPLLFAAYIVVAAILAVLLVRWLRSRPMTFKRAYVGCFALTLLAIAALVAWIAAQLVYRAAAGNVPAAEPGVDVTRP